MGTQASVLNLNTSLTVKELAFVEAYMTNGGNATQACREAGYIAKTENAMSNK